MTGQAVVQTDGTTPERAGRQPVTSAHLEERSFDALADARQAVVRLLCSEVLADCARDLLRDVAARIDQTVARKRELGHIDKELEGARERWPEWHFRRDDSEWVADAKDGMCCLRSSSLPALEEKIRREEDMWSQFSGQRLPLRERLRWAEANRALGRAEG
jgi:hypothetical protein